MKTEIIQYKPLHAFELYDRQIRESEFVLSAVPGWDEAAMRWAGMGPAFTLMVDNRVEACGGIIMIDETFGECWLLIPKSAYGIIIYRAIIKKLSELMKQCKFRRLQAFVLEGFDHGENLVKRLGFELEGRLRKYGPNGENLHLYAKVF